MPEWFFEETTPFYEVKAYATLKKKNAFISHRTN